MGNYKNDSQKAFCPTGLVYLGLFILNSPKILSIEMLHG